MGKRCQFSNLLLTIYHMKKETDTCLFSVGLITEVHIIMDERDLYCQTEQVTL